MPISFPRWRADDVMSQGGRVNWPRRAGVCRVLGQTLLAPAPSTHLPWARKEPSGNRWKLGRAAPGAAGTVTLGSRRRAGASGHYSLHEPGVSAVGCWHHPLRPGEGFEVRAAPLGRLEQEMPRDSCSPRCHTDGETEAERDRYLFSQNWIQNFVSWYSPMVCATSVPPHPLPD